MYIARVERRCLAGMLRDGGAAWEACRRAVLAGGRFWIAENAQPDSALVAVYARHT